MVPPAFPLLLIFPALAIDFTLRKAGETRGRWRQMALALGLGAVFLSMLLMVQWFFARFLLSSYADNWFFAGNRYWGYGAGPGEWRTSFLRVNKGSPDADLVTASALGISWALASIGAWIGLLWGNWMRKVQR